ncbi:MAG: DUF63 family protein [Candidatus Aenigmarchaeota archaeon]|nr:DUF63 family protein [Candidatus Aenigmarchaeota archaeon]
MAFLEDYFLNPILQNGYFNPVNTAVYAVVLVVAVVLVFKLLFRLKIPIDRRFFYAVLPFVVWGSSTRVLHDAAFAGKLSPGLNAFYGLPVFPTPGSYFITFTLAIGVLLASLGVWKFRRVAYWKTMAVVGWALVALNLLLTPWADPVPLALVAGLVAVCTGIIYGLSHLPLSGVKRALSIPHQVILGGHFLDAAATYVALTFYGYGEQHVLPRFVFDLTGPVGFFFLKALVVIPVLWFIDRSSEDRNFTNFLKIVVFILGFAPGLRDLLRLLAGV